MLRSVDGIRPGAAPGGGQELLLSRARSTGGDLIERDGELDTLALSLAALEDRIGGVVTVMAPAGPGKTTLLDRATAGATEAGYLVRCHRSAAAARSDRGRGLTHTAAAAGL